MFSVTALPQRKLTDMKQCYSHDCYVMPCKAGTRGELQHNCRPLLTPSYRQQSVGAIQQDVPGTFKHGSLHSCSDPRFYPATKEKCEGKKLGGRGGRQTKGQQIPNSGSTNRPIRCSYSGPFKSSHSFVPVQQLDVLQKVPFTFTATV